MTHILVPYRRPLRCGYCPNLIEIQQDDILLVHDRPMCLACRAVQLSKHRNRILGDKEAAERDQAARDRQKDQQEVDRVETIAAESVQETRAQNKELRKKKAIT